MTRPTRTLVLTLALALAGAPAALAQQGAPQPTTPVLTVAAENRTAAAAAARGAKRADDRAVPGDTLRYTLTFVNGGATPVRSVELKNPIAAGVRFVGGSTAASRDDARAEFSIDGGRSWSAQPMEEVVVEGQAVRRPVSPDRYTNVRWVVAGAVAPKAVVTARFDAVVTGDTVARRAN